LFDSEGLYFEIFAPLGCYAAQIGYRSFGATYRSHRKGRFGTNCRYHL